MRPERDAEASPSSSAEVKKYSRAIPLLSLRAFVAYERAKPNYYMRLREERRLRVFGNRVLRRIFASKRDEVTREWRKLHNEELNDLCSSLNIVRVIKSRRIRWTGM